MKKSFDELSVYHSKSCKRYMPIDSLAEYADRGEDLFTELAMAGLVRKRNHEGHKTRVPAKLFTTSKFGRFMWISRKSDFEGSDREIQESHPVFALSCEGARELMRLHALRFDREEDAVAQAQAEVKPELE